MKRGSFSAPNRYRVWNPVMARLFIYVPTLTLALAHITCAQTDLSHIQYEPYRSRHKKWLAEWEAKTRLRLGFERPHNRIWLFPLSASAPLEANMRVFLGHGDEVRMIRKLSDLKGSVRISTSEDALRFVRLKTSPATYYAWPGNDFEVEVVERTNSWKLPNYGYRDYPLSEVRSGMLGVLSHSAFVKGSFKPASISASKNGYVIERWIYCVQLQYGEPIRERVKKIREVVTADGGYSRTVLRNTAPPILPGTRWYLSI